MRIVLQNIYKINIFKRLVPTLLKFYIKLFKNNKIIIKHKNIFLKLNLLNPIDREIYLKGYYEDNQIKYLEELIKKYEIKNFIDIGAHMGFYSIMLYNEKTKVFSFEPIKNNFKQLSENKHLNNFDDMDIFNFALSNVKKEIELWVPDINKTGGYSIYDTKDMEITKYNLNKIKKQKGISKIGDDVIKISNERVAIKIDVERHEFNVLEGLTKLLKKNEIIIQVELFKEKQQKIMKYLQSLNFKHINTIENDFYFKNF